jgi:hypothetical protein
LIERGIATRVQAKNVENFASVGYHPRLGTLLRLPSISIFFGIKSSERWPRSTYQAIGTVERPPMIRRETGSVSEKRGRPVMFDIRGQRAE